MSFPCSSVGKESACNAGDLGLIPGLGRSPGEGNGNPLQYSFWRIPWTEESGRLQSMGLQRVGHNLATKPPNTTTTSSNTYCFERFTEKKLFEDFILKFPEIRYVRNMFYHPNIVAHILSNLICYLLFYIFGTICCVSFNSIF